MTKPKRSLLDPALLKPAALGALQKLDPRVQSRNPVMFVTELGAIACTLFVLRDVFVSQFSSFNLQITLWLWFTVVFANFAEALAEGRGKAQAESLKKARKDTIARRLRDGQEERVPAPNLQKGDIVVCEAGDVGATGTSLRWL